MSTVAAYLFERLQHAPDAPPLFDKTSAVMRKGDGEGLREDGRGGMQAVAKRDAQRKFVAPAQVDLAQYGDIAVFGAVKLPIHPVIVAQVLPAVAGAHKTAGSAQEAAGTPQGEKGSVLP